MFCQHPLITAQRYSKFILTRKEEKVSSLFPEECLHTHSHATAAAGVPAVFICRAGFCRKREPCRSVSKYVGVAGTPAAKMTRKMNTHLFLSEKQDIGTLYIYLSLSLVVGTTRPKVLLIKWRRWKLIVISFNVILLCIFFQHITMSVLPLIASQSSAQARTQTMATLAFMAGRRWLVWWRLVAAVGTRPGQLCPPWPPPALRSTLPHRSGGGAARPVQPPHCSRTQHPGWCWVRPCLSFVTSLCIVNMRGPCYDQMDRPAVHPSQQQRIQTNSPQHNMLISYINTLCVPTLFGHSMKTTARNASKFWM